MRYLYPCAVLGTHPPHRGSRLPCPYDAESGFVTMHPWFPFALISQSVEFTSVLDCTAFGECVHPCYRIAVRTWVSRVRLRRTPRAPRGTAGMWLKTYRVSVEPHVTARILVHGFEGVDLGNIGAALGPSKRSAGRGCSCEGANLASKGPDGR